MLKSLSILGAAAAVLTACAGASNAHLEQPSADPAGIVPLSRYDRTGLAGFTVLVDPGAEAEGVTFRRVRAALLVDLETIEARVPAPALDVLRESRIVITPRTPARGAFTGRGMCFHESAAWLTENGFDVEREGTVEICNMDDFLLWRAEQPMMTLHELAHAYHWRLGFDRPDVVEAYGAARDAGLYAGVAYALAPEGDARRAYALVNAKEYFAELSEAYFGRNDYFPFTREDLRAYDARGSALVERLWSLTREEITGERTGVPSGSDHRGSRPTGIP